MGRRAGAGGKGKQQWSVFVQQRHCTEGSGRTEQTRKAKSDWTMAMSHAEL